MDKNNGLVLDEDAQRLFAELGGMDERDRRDTSPLTRDGFVDTLSEEEKQIDVTRMWLVEVAYCLAACLTSYRATGRLPKREEEIDPLLKAVGELTRAPYRGDKIILRFRGLMFSADGVDAANSDYVISCGNVAVDMAMVKSLTRRQGVSQSHLPGRLARSFELLSSIDIHTLHVALGLWRPEQIEAIARSAMSLSTYYAVVAGWTGDLQKNAANGSALVVNNEFNQPDPNLTLVAGVNNLKADTIRGLVQKIDQMMRQSGAGNPLDGFPSVYEAMFAFKKIRGQLVKPPIEVNNMRWLIASRGQAAISREKAQITRQVMGRFGHAPQKAARIMEGIFGAETHQVTADVLENQLEDVTDFLSTLDQAEPTPAQDHIEAEVLQGIRDRLDTVREEVLEDLIVHGANIALQRSAAAGRQEVRLHAKVLDLLSFFKLRSGTKQKIRHMIRQSIDFDAQDYETLARDFYVTPEEARHLVDLLRGCFNSEGRFLRDAFDRNLADFIRYEKKVFEFLWSYLKDIQVRDDRVAFLNSLQTLIARMSSPQPALTALLNDLVSPPDGVSYQDRNGLMLANILLRKYNKENKNDIELTPEEVLLVQAGLDRDTADHAVYILDTRQEMFFHKIRTIHTRMKESLEPPENGRPGMPFRYLSTLEREIYIFISLVGGDTSHRIMRSAVREYGDPDAQVYWLKKSRDEMKTLMQLFQVAVRGLGRFRDGADAYFLREARRQEDRFLGLARGDQRHADTVRRVMKWIDTEMERIATAAAS